MIRELKSGQVYIVVFNFFFFYYSWEHISSVVNCLIEKSLEQQGRVQELQDHVFLLIWLKEMRLCALYININLQSDLSIENLKFSGGMLKKKSKNEELLFY